MRYAPWPVPQDGGTCYLFSAAHALSTIAAYRAVQRGWYDPWGEEPAGNTYRDRSFLLSPVSMFACSKCGDVIDMAQEVGLPDNCVDPYRPFGEWRMGLPGLHPATSNPDQNDSDLDGSGDVCDSSYSLDNDPDGDGVPSDLDNCPWTRARFLPGQRPLSCSIARVWAWAGT